MKHNNRRISKENFKNWVNKPVYPFFFFLIPVYQWFVHNIDELVSLNVLLFLTAVFTAIYCVIYLIFGVFFKKNSSRKALCFLGFSVFFFIYGRLFDTIFNEAIHGSGIYLALIILFVSLLVFVVFVLFTKKIRNFEKLNKSLNFFVISFL